MASESAELTCYNKGCGKTFRLEDNKEDSCTYHPGAPFFHDAYKGWTCCNKKCTDFTEFLNFKGCSTAFHSNVKPPEPEKPAVEKLAEDEVIEVRPPIPEAMPRPHYDTPMEMRFAPPNENIALRGWRASYEEATTYLVQLTPAVSSGLVQQMRALVVSPATRGADCNPAPALIPPGTACKHSGCRALYGGEGDGGRCTHHPGYPVFHEGLKFWTCCVKKTSDFDVFLDQQGCTVGDHVWLRERAEGDRRVDCRHDWHQTGGDVVVSVFAKKYDPDRSSVRLSPVRLAVELLFPQEDSVFTLDVELRGVVDVAQSRVQMFQTKVEVKLKKAELGSWSRLDIPRPQAPPPAVPQPIAEPVPACCDESVDLSDL